MENLEDIVNKFLKRSSRNGRDIYESINQELKLENKNNDDLLLLINAIGKFLLRLKAKQCVDYMDVSTVVEVLHVCFNKININYNDDGSSLLSDCSIICECCALLPDQLLPIRNENEGEDRETLEKNLNLCPVVTECCVKFYMDVLCCKNQDLDWKNDLVSKVLGKFEKHILSRSAGRLITLLGSRMGNFPWTNKVVKDLSEKVLKIICNMTNHPTVVSLMSGVDPCLNGDVIFFKDGLLDDTLKVLIQQFTKESWKSLPMIKHVLIWSITKVKHPFLGRFVTKIVPCLLLMIDDFSTSNKLLGISTMHYLIENVNPSDLKIYGHADVMYDALYKQLFSNDDRLYEVTLPCLLKILLVLEHKSNYVKGISFSKWDITFEKMLNNLNFSSKLSTQRILLKNIQQYIDKMGGNIIKHFEKILQVVTTYLAQYSDENEQIRLCTLNVLEVTIQNTWPIISKHDQVILKCLLKLLIDLQCGTIVCTDKVSRTLKKKVQSVLTSMRRSVGASFDMMLQDIIECQAEEKFHPVQEFLAGVLQINLDVK